MVVRRRVTKRPRRRATLRAVADALALPATGIRLLDLLAKQRATLTVPDMVRRLRASERIVRSYLRVFAVKGILIRSATLTNARRTAFRYAVVPLDKLLEAAAQELEMRVSTITSLQRARRTGLANL